MQCTCKWFAHFKIRTHLQVKREAPLIPNLQVTCILCQLKIHLGVPLLWGAGCTRQGRKTFLTRGPPVKVNFELATPNSVRGCTLALPTWCRMCKGAGVHCARAVHVQIFCTCSSFAAPTGQTVRAADAKLAGHMHASPAYMFLWLPFVWGAGCARQDRKSLFERDPPVLGNF